jgi:hypothetical protein
VYNKFINFIKEKNFKGTKECHHKYISNYYAAEFCDKREEELIVVEIGVRGGFDLAMFADWFHKSEVFGIDIKESFKNSKNNIPESEWGSYDLSIEELNNCHFILGNGYDDKIVNFFGDETIDYLIDDGSHVLNDQLKCIEKYFNKIKKGGKIIIEDVGCHELTSNPCPNKCIESIFNKAEELGCTARVYDLTEITKIKFSIIIEITKR